MGYRPGLITWIVEKADLGDRLTNLEDEINEMTLAWDEQGLKAALEEYKAFFLEALSAYHGQASLFSQEGGQKQ